MTSLLVTGKLQCVDLYTVEDILRTENRMSSLFKKDLHRVFLGGRGGGGRRRGWWRRVTVYTKSWVGWETSNSEKSSYFTDGNHTILAPEFTRMEMARSASQSTWLTCGR